jgi:TATA-box binding protein (TBP) (component of TFIID and TFIIIB)
MDPDPRYEEQARKERGFLEAPQGPAKPAVRLLSVTSTASVGVPIDLKAVDQALQGAGDNPGPLGWGQYSRRQDSLVFVQKRIGDSDQFRESTTIMNSGNVTFTGATSEAQARQSIQDVVRLLQQRIIQTRDEPVIDVKVDAQVNFGQGIEIESIPVRLPDSMFARDVPGDYERGLGASVRGTHNKGGALVNLSSREDCLRAVTDVSGRRPIVLMLFACISYCKIRASSAVAEMFRAVDEDGNILKTGYAQLTGAKGESEVQESARAMGVMLEEAGLFGPPTPRDRIPDGVRVDELEGEGFIREL